jgi:lipoprotein-anchoring transpeptidase ErfK/SrfK
VSRYGLKKAPKARRRKTSGFFAWVLLLSAVSLLGWIVWTALKPAPSEKATPRVVVRNQPRGLTNTAPVIPLIVAVPTNRPTNPVHAPGANIENRPGMVHSFFEAQVALARLGISPGAIDGSGGSQTRSALRAYQAREGLPITGDLDPATKGHLILTDPPYSYYITTTNDLENLEPTPETWIGKSERSTLGYENLSELVAERSQSSVALVRLLNPQLEWDKVPPGTLIRIPWVIHPPVTQKAAFIRILLHDKVLEVFGSSSNLLAHFPCSIAKKVEKRPIGRLTVAKIALNPNYVFDPAIFPESEEAREIDHKLVIPPGPNNPVGVAWIGLDKPGYGIHGTPKPEQVGRTESHGCFRLANWNAEYLAQMVSVGLPVFVEP